MPKFRAAANFGRVAGFRSYFPQGGLKVGQTANLDAAESRHLVKALRARVGDAVTLFDGVGGAWSGRLTDLGRQAQVRIEAVMGVPRPAPIYLAIGLLKGKGLDAVIKCAVELGIAGVIPLETRNSEVRLDADRAESKLEHWRTVAIEAAKQSGNLAKFELSVPQRLTDWLKQDFGDALTLVASLQPGAKPLAQQLPPGQRRVIALVGPEGDFSPEEYAQMTNFSPVALGPHVLRAETASVYFMSVIHAQHLVNDNLT